MRRVVALLAALVVALALSLVHAPTAQSSEPACTVVWLDGDGQYGARRPSSDYLIGGPDGLAAVAAEHGCGLWVPQPPGGQSTWWQRGRDNAPWLHVRLPEGRLILGGYSGGAQLITEYLLPAYTLPAGTRVLLVGGGDRPRVRATAAGNHALRWVTGAADRDGGDGWDSLEAAMRGHAWYSAAGWATSSSWPAGVTHDDYAFGSLLREMLAADSTVTPAPTPAPTVGASVRPSTPRATPLPHRTPRPHARHHHHHYTRGVCRAV